MALNKTKLIKISKLAVILFSVMLIPVFVINAAEKAPDFTLYDLNGEEISLSDYQGKVVLLNFWATWCPPCRMEIPHFIEMYNELKDKGFVILGVSVDRQGPQTVRKWVVSNNVNYPILMNNDRVGSDYQSLLSPSDQGGIPFTFIIDKEGNIANKVVGYREKKDWESMVLPLLD